VSRFRTFALGLALAAGLPGCSFVDSFSDRAVNFNFQAEQAQLQALLLNIVRASLNRPMQFTSLQSMSGQQSVTAGGTLTYPFGYTARRPAATSNPNILSLTGSASAAPSFTVSVLDTQEFYQGELSPLTGQEYHFFVEEGYTPAQLLYLFANSIDLNVAGGTDAQHFTFANYVGTDYDFEQFSLVADYLLSLGLTLEQTRHNQQVGPQLTAADLQKNLAGIANLSTAGYHITQAKPRGAGEKAAGGAAAGGAAAPPKAAAAGAKPSKRPAKKTAAKSEPAAEPGRFDIEKSTVNYRPCFEPALLALSGKVSMVDKSLVCSPASSQPEEETQTDGSLSRAGGFIAPELAAAIAESRRREVFRLRNEVEWLKANHGDPAKIQQETALADGIAKLPPIPPNAKLQFRIATRSTEAIMFFLGSVIAREHQAAGLGRSAGQGARYIQVKVGEPYLPYPAAPCPPSATGAPQSMGSFTCENLFVVDVDRADSKSPLVVDYDGKTWSVPAEAAKSGRTLRIVDLVKQLLALHTSAKSLPASNVLNILGPIQ
jgi:hypothetical protein